MPSDFGNLTICISHQVFNMVGFAFVFLLFLRREVSLDVIAIPMIHCVMKNVFLLIVVIIVSSCAKQQMEQQQLSVLSIETKSTNDCYVYNTSAKIWMTIQDDPYKVSNLQTIAQSNGIDVLVKPTHYALKLFPKNEQELNNLIIRDDISFSYIPFGYTCVSASIADSLSRSNNTCKYREEEKILHRVTTGFPQATAFACIICCMAS